MLIRRKSPLTGEWNEVELPITQAQLAELEAPNRRTIQEILPHLTAAQREFVKTGYTQDDWDSMFPDE